MMIFSAIKKVLHVVGWYLSSLSLQIWMSQMNTCMLISQLLNEAKSTNTEKQSKE